MQHVVMFSGGLLSWAAAKRVVNRHGTANTVLLFTDTRVEDEDLYRFLHEAAANIGAPLITVADGRTPWELARDKNFISNSRVAKCSIYLKQKVARAWLDTNCVPAATRIYLGYDWNEMHRLEPARQAWLPWHCEAPMCYPPLLGHHHLRDWLASEGIRLPRLYAMGFAHNNCGGACVKGGQAQWAHLLRMLPERYAAEEATEQALRQEWGKDVSILRDRRGGKTIPLTLLDLRKRIESGGQLDLFDWGGCGCFVDSPEAEE